MRFRFCLLIGFVGLLIPNYLSAQPVQKDPPKLIVEVVVEQLRYEMIERYWDAIGDKGIKRLIRSGVTFEHMQYDLAHVSNASGVATLATGFWPRDHGIIG